MRATTLSLFHSLVYPVTQKKKVMRMAGWHIQMLPYIQVFFIKNKKMQQKNSPYTTFFIYFVRQKVNIKYNQPP